MASSKEPVSTPGVISRVWLEPPQPRLTFFHSLWLLGAGIAAFFGYYEGMHRHLGLLGRIAAGFGGLVVGVPVVGLLVMLLVTVVVIPRLGRFTAWHYEVECYMLSILGDKWRDAGTSEDEHK